MRVRASVGVGVTCTSSNGAVNPDAEGCDTFTPTIGEPAHARVSFACTCAHHPGVARWGMGPVRSCLGMAEGNAGW